jgi:lipoprotein-anchoring transpeptidase ErfK/SrfK
VLAAPRRQRRLPTSAILAIAATASLFVCLSLVVGSVLVTYIYYQFSGLILPGVSVGEVQLDNMTLSQAAVALHKTWNLETRIQVTNGVQTQLVAPSDLGLQLDAVQTAQEAHAVGHGGSPLAEMGQVFASLVDGWQVEPVITLDQAAARAGLEALTPQMSQPPRDANLRLEGGSLVAVPGQLGYSLDIDQTLAVLAADPQSVLENGRLQVVPLPLAPRLTDVSPAIAEAQHLLDTPASLQAYDPITDEHLAWAIPPETIGAWLKIEPGEQGPRATFDPAQVARYLDGLSAELGAGRYLDSARYSAQVAETVLQGLPAAISVSHTPTSYTIQAGDTLLKIGWKLGFPMWIILQSNPGLDPDHLLVGSELVIPSKDDLLPLEAIPNKRILIDIGKQRLSVFQDGALLHKYVISTGIDRSPTQPGVFQVQTHERKAYASVWDLYMPHFLGIYEAWPGFMNGIHGLPTLSNGQRLWANILGKPASYGCIILDLDDAEWLYQWAENGVVVEIRP